MLYKGNDYNLEDYFNTVMKEDGFVDDSVDKVRGYYRDEADYIGSCGLEKEEDIAFIKSKGYVIEDFIDED